jgi:type IV secretion system protein VirD4
MWNSRAAMKAATPAIDPTLPSHRERPVFLGYLVILAGIVLSLEAMTQYLAARYAYSPTLGSPLLRIGTIAIYTPDQAFGWLINLFHRDGLVRPITISLAVFVGGFALSVFASFVLNAIVSRRQSLSGRYLHGSAHFATKQDIVNAGLLRRRNQPNEGVYVGGWQERRTTHYLRHNGPEHVLAFAPTRSGKGVGLVLPTLLSWPHSALVLDIKGEAWAFTSGWRSTEAGTVCLKFDPSCRDGSSIAYNPLSEIRLGEDIEVADAQNIATMIVDVDGKGLYDHWTKTSQALLVGAILHCCYREQQAGREATLATIAQEFSDPTCHFSDTMTEWLEAEHDPLKHRGWTAPNGTRTATHPVVAATARDMMNREEKEASSVLSTANSFLTLYRDPIVAHHTSRSDVRIADLMQHDKPVSLYLIVNPADKDRLKPLIRLMLTQITRRLLERMEYAGGEVTPHYRHRLLMLLDEFPSLGKLEVFEETLAVMGGYGIKAFLIIQNLEQLRQRYGQYESIVANCHIRCSYAPNKYETAELLSKMTGTTTIQKSAVNVSGRRMAPWLAQTSVSIQEVQRPLLTPDEVMRLKGPIKDAVGRIKEPGDMLIFSAGFPPIYGRQILHFQDQTFKARAALPAAHWVSLHPPADAIEQREGRAGAFSSRLSSALQQALQDTDDPNPEAASFGTIRHE